MGMAVRRSCKKTRRAPSFSCTCLCSRFMKRRKSQVRKTIRKPAGISTTTKRQSRITSITRAAASWTRRPMRLGTRETMLSATRTASLVMRLSHSAECTALTAP